MKAPCLKSKSLSESGRIRDGQYVSRPDGGRPVLDPGAAPAVALSSFTPKKGGAGTKMTIMGKNLTQVSAVVVGGATVTVDSQSAAKLVVTVPGSSSTGLVSIVADSAVVAKALFTAT